MNRLPILLILYIGLTVFTSCGGGRQNGETEKVIVPKASVTTTNPVMGSIEDELVLNGKTVYLKKFPVAAPISGYITAVHVSFGDMVEPGQVLFEMQTRENKALEESGNAAPGFGIIQVKAPSPGVINEPVAAAIGAYMVEGSTLCSLANNNDLMVIVNVPYENHEIVKAGTRCHLMLPDHTQIKGVVFQIRPYVDENSQTQEVLIKPVGNRALPENMNLTASFLNSEKTETLLLPKKALLTNETQEKFWVMKIVDDSVAVMVPVQTGIKNDSVVEVVSSGLTPENIVILEGGYGLEDSSLVNIVHQP